MPARSGSLLGSAMSKESLKRLAERLDPKDVFGIAAGQLSPPQSVELPKKVDLAPLDKLLLGIGQQSRQTIRDLECEIAVALHKALSPILTERELGDPRFWEWMTTTRFRDFVLARWPLNANDTQGKWRLRWCCSANLGGFSRNALARLYFSAGALHQAGTHDEYALAKTALKKADLFAQVFERHFSIHPALAQACVAEWEPLQEDLVREKARVLTLRLGMLAAESLGATDARALVASL